MTSSYKTIPAIIPRATYSKNTIVFSRLVDLHHKLKDFNLQQYEDLPRNTN